MPKSKAKAKDFAKQKLKVGKSKPGQSNATDTSFTAKSISVPTQGPGRSSPLQTHLSLTKHHQAIARRQAVIHLNDHFNEYHSSETLIISAVAPLIVDEDRTVRQAVLKLIDELDATVVVSFIRTILLYIHAAMTHINPGIRSEATLYLDVLLKSSPAETVRLGFTRTLQLFFPLLGWRLDTKTQADVVTTTLSFGKTAAKTKLVHLQSLYKLLEAGLAENTTVPPLLLDTDTYKFLIPPVTNPFALVLGTDPDGTVTDDVDARKLVVDAVKSALDAGLASSIKEGGEIGRLAGKLITIAQ